MDSALFRSPISRILIGGTSIFSLVLFAAVWIATLATSGFSLAGDHTFAGWTYFPLFWPHLAAATLGILLFLRYGANYATATTVVIVWLVALISNTYGTVLYWRLGWLCNITGKDKLTDPIDLEICNSENALLISLWVLSTVLWIISIIAPIAHGFDYFQAGRSGSAAPGRNITAELIMLGGAAILTLLVFAGLWIAALITSSVSVAGGSSSQTYGVWTHSNIFLVQLSSAVLGLMVFLRYGANYVTGIASIILWAVSFFAATYGTVLYWRLGWFCKIATGTTLRGVDLIICRDEDSYLIALWVMSTLLWVFSIVGPIAHAFDLPAAGRSGTINPLTDKYSVDGGGVAPPDDAGQPRLDPQGVPIRRTQGTAAPVDQYGTYNDGSVFSASKLATAGGRGTLRRAGRPILRGAAAVRRKSPKSSSSIV